MALYGIEERTGCKLVLPSDSSPKHWQVVSYSDSEGRHPVKTPFLAYEGHDLCALGCDVLPQNLVVSVEDITTEALAFLLYNRVNVTLTSPQFSRDKVSFDAPRYARFCAQDYLCRYADYQSTDDGEERLRLLEEAQDMIRELQAGGVVYQLVLLHLVRCTSLDTFLFTMYYRDTIEGQPLSPPYQAFTSDDLAFRSTEDNCPFLVDLEALFAALSEADKHLLQENGEPSKAFYAVMIDLLAPSTTCEPSSIKNYLLHLVDAYKLSIRLEKIISPIPLFYGFQMLRKRTNQENYRWVRQSNKAGLLDKIVDLIGGIAEFSGLLLFYARASASTGKETCTHLLTCFSAESFLHFLQDAKCAFLIEQLDLEHQSRLAAKFFNNTTAEEALRTFDSAKLSYDFIQDLTPANNDIGNVFRTPSFFAGYLATKAAILASSNNRLGALQQDIDWFIADRKFCPAALNKLIYCVYSKRSGADSYDAQLPSMPVELEAALVGYLLEKVFPDNVELEAFSAEMLKQFFDYADGKRFRPNQAVAQEEQTTTQFSNCIRQIVSLEWLINYSATLLLTNGIERISQALSVVSDDVLLAWIESEAFANSFIQAASDILTEKWSRNTEKSRLNALVDMLCKRSLIQQKLVAAGVLTSQLGLYVLHLQLVLPKNRESAAGDLTGFSLLLRQYAEAFMQAIPDDSVGEVLYNLIVSNQLSIVDVFAFGEVRLLKAIGTFATTKNDTLSNLITQSLAPMLTGIDTSTGRSLEQKSACAKSHLASHVHTIWALTKSLPLVQSVMRFTDSDSIYASLLRDVSFWEAVKAKFSSQSDMTEDLSFLQSTLATWLCQGDNLMNVLLKMSPTDEAVSFLLSLVTQEQAKLAFFNYFDSADAKETRLIDFLLTINSWQTMERSTQRQLINGIGGLSELVAMKALDDTECSVRVTLYEFSENAHYKNYVNSSLAHIAIIKLLPYFSAEDQVQFINSHCHTANESNRTSLAHSLLNYYNYRRQFLANIPEQYHLPLSEIESFLTVLSDDAQCAIFKWLTIGNAGFSVSYVFKFFANRHGGFPSPNKQLFDLILPALTVNKFFYLLSNPEIKNDVLLRPEYYCNLHISLVQRYFAARESSVDQVSTSSEWKPISSKKNSLILSAMWALTKHATTLNYIFYQFTFFYYPTKHLDDNKRLLAKILQQFLASCGDVEDPVKHLVHRWQLTIDDYDAQFSAAWDTFFSESGLNQSLCETFGVNVRELVEAMRYAVHRVFISPLEEERLAEQQRIEEIERRAQEEAVKQQRLQALAREAELRDLALRKMQDEQEKQQEPQHTEAALDDRSTPATKFKAINTDAIVRQLVQAASVNQQGQSKIQPDSADVKVQATKKSDVSNTMQKTMSVDNVAENTDANTTTEQAEQILSSKTGYEVTQDGNIENTIQHSGKQPITDSKTETLNNQLVTEINHQGSLETSLDKTPVEKDPQLMPIAVASSDKPALWKRCAIKFKQLTSAIKTTLARLINKLKVKVNWVLKGGKHETENPSADKPMGMLETVHYGASESPVPIHKSPISQGKNMEQAISCYSAHRAGTRLNQSECAATLYCND